MRRLSLLTMKKSAPTNSSGGPPAKKNHWSGGLLASMQDPELKVLEDDDVIVIKDKYPKAKFHYLVMPKKDIPALKHVTKENIDLLEHMEKVGENLTKEHKDHDFIVGYHAVPSMQRLHLHVISTDFNSPCLKTKQHWNSFTTPFFIPSRNVRIQLEKDGRIKLNTEANNKYLLENLKCHKCSKLPKNMPELKRHLLEHLPSEEK
ncbi:aprataxin [Belonocnema kinseyi]|uniref:aprataxin n=1 Tax=Belonocnema kinseyi TaxID=2817044 RepID=UPI00143E087B|nr:aprataxin [Belonocnema kinseyi]XP_033211597.1 aprataxin [Belonocnema kinseyi]XP_033211598.1 aprataxin [Belonocnema kinseyi]